MNITQAMIEQVYQDSRYAQLHEVLPALIQSAIEPSAQGLAYQGFALAQSSASSARRVVDVHGNPVEESRLTWLEQDRLLSWLTLQVATVADDHKVSRTMSTLIASARLGLVTRTLDMAHQHLQGRKSFGQKTTRHQLIKASFSDIYGDVTQLRYQLLHRLETENHHGVEAEHQAITRLANQAEKLMGGHGFLMGATHTVSHLSMLLYSLFGKQPSTEGTT
ncbi:hypothetical protein Xvie_03631 [Xenorhabdus vietnamensis]|uniref:Acyl-CoA dehydrogenase/oxidase C-terminal domain-containing protein n=1 Tax=Xenorhabdus vietnamensis TaxID=351656 RepID=A0A1Y2S8T0_9GAMM|nr:hypothetical protein Xvie_03631 [Xenorhabdus vietnamensis]